MISASPKKTPALGGPELQNALSLYRANQKVEEERATQEFERSKSYTTLVVSLGYAGMFGVWNYVSTAISPAATACTAILAGISLVLFVIYEVMKMFVMQRNVTLRFKLNSIEPDFHDIDGLSRFSEKLQTRREEMESARATSIRSLVSVWPYFFYPTVVTGFGAMFLLLYNALARLTGLPYWPQ